MRQIIKPKPMFNRTNNINQIFKVYSRRYPKSKQPDETNIVESSGINLSKLEVEEQLLYIRANFLNVKVWFIETNEDLTKMLDYIKKYDTVSMDTETNNPQKFHFPSVYLWSISVKPNEAFVIPFKFNKIVSEYLVNTKQMVVMHNAGYDMKIVNKMTGKFIKNFADTLLIEYSYVNNAVNTPSLSLKNLAKQMYGNWSESVTDLTEDCIHDEKLLYYSGIDSMSTLWLYNKNKEKILAEESIDLFNIFPAEHPKKRSYSREWFYKNVAVQLLPLTIDFMNNGIHFDINRLEKLNTKLEDELARIDKDVKNLPITMKYWTKLSKTQAITKSRKYEIDRLETINLNSKSLSPNNPLFLELLMELKFPNLTKPSKSKNWTYTVLKNLIGEKNILTLAVKNKDLESLRYTEDYSKLFEKVDSIIIDDKKQENIKKCTATRNNMYLNALTSYDFKVLSSAKQKKYILNKGYKIFSNEKSSKTGEDSFGRKEIERLLKQEKEGEAKKFLQLAVDYSSASVIKKNFIENILAGHKDGTMYSNYRIGSTKTFRPSSGGGSRDRKKDPELLGAINLLNQPSSGNRYASEYKHCITVPSDEWVWIAADFTALEENCMGNISGDKTKTKILKEGFDSHCVHAPAYFNRIEEILGKNDGSLEWNKNFKLQCDSNKELAQLRQDSKPISFSLAYLAGLTGLFRSVGYTKDVFSDEIRFKDYTYTIDLEKQINFEGKEYITASKTAIWYNVEDYKHLDTKYHDFFEKAVLPAKLAHSKYHNEMYNGLKTYREDIVIPQIKKYKNYHIGLGLYINHKGYMSNGVVRTLNNSGFQGWSWLALIAMEKFRRVCVENKQSDNVKNICSIYDSTYFLVKRDVATLKWVAKTLKPILEAPYLENQEIPLKAELEISLDSWSDFIKFDTIENLEEYIN